MIGRLDVKLDCTKDVRKTRTAWPGAFYSRYRHMHVRRLGLRAVNATATSQQQCVVEI